MKRPLFKKKKSFKDIGKKIVTTSVLAITLGSIMFPATSAITTVYADTEDDVSKVEADTSKGVDGITNPAVRQLFKDRSAFHFGTYYSTVFQYLNGTYLDTNGYSKQYTGISASGNSAFSEGMLGYYLEPDFKKDIGQDADTSDALDANTALTDTETGEESNKDDLVGNIVNSRAKEIAKTLVKDLEPMYTSNYKAVEKDSGDVTFEYGSKYSDSVTKELIQTMIAEDVVSVINKSKTFLDTSKTQTERENALRKDLKEFFDYEAYGSLRFSTIDKTDTYRITVEKDPQTSISKYNERMLDLVRPEMSEKLRDAINEGMDKKNVSTLMKIGNVPTSLGATSSDRTVSVKFYANLSSAYFSNKNMEPTDYELLNRVFGYGYMSVDNYSDNKKEKETFTKKIKTYNTKKNSILGNLSFSDIIGKMDSSVSSDMSKEPLMSYTPLTAYLSQEGFAKFSLKDYKKYISSKGYDVSEKFAENADGYYNIIDSQGGVRAIQVQDLLLESNKDTTNSRILSGDKSKNRGQVYVGSGDLFSSTPINSFLGLYYEDKERKSYTNSDFDFVSTMKGENMTGGAIMNSAISTSYKFAKKQVGNLPATESVIALGLDNYGNIIATETGDVMIPAWQNTLFIPDINAKKVSINVAMKNDVKQIQTAVKDNNKSTYSFENVRKEALKKIESTKAYFNSTNKATVKAQVTEFYEGKSDYDIALSLKNMSQKDLSTLAMIIALATRDDVNNFNKTFMSSLDNGMTMFVYPTATNFLSQEDYDDYKLARWTASSLISKIGWMIDYGFFEIVRLTFAQMAVNLYDGLVSWAGNVFYTSNVTQTETWKNALQAMTTILFAIMIIYTSYASFLIFSNRLTFKDVFIKVLVLIGLVIIPYTGYNVMTETIINQPAHKVLNNTVKQSLVVDFMKDKQLSNTNGASEELLQAYQELFGNNKNAENLTTTKNYLLTFYTTTNKQGEDISQINTNTKSNGWFSGNSKTKNTLTNQYNKNNLVSVQATIFDLYVWSTEQVALKVGSAEDQKNLVNNPELLQEETFFQYLGRKYGDKYAGIDNYDEYSINMSSLYTQEVLNNGVFSDNVNNTSLGNITASRLFYELQKNSLNLQKSNSGGYALQQGLASLVKLVNIFNLDYKYTTSDKYYVPTSDDLDMFIRDLSMVASTRETTYGSSADATRSFSDFTLSVYNKSEKYLLPSEAKQDYVPKEDYFGVYTTITNLMSSQSEINNKRYSNAKKSTYKVVSKTLGTVAKDYANIEKILDADLGNTATNSALQMSILLELYFNLIDELGMKNFPSDYEAKSVSFDALLKMLYIPISSYKFQQVSTSDVLITNMIEYISLRENIFIIVLVFITALLLFALWLFYWFIFQFIMLVLIMYKFIKEYLIGSNYNNKSWKGALYIYAILGLVKLGLAIVWWLAFSILNSAFANYGGLPYNPSAVHSIAVILYIYVTFMKILVPLMSDVIQDFDNLGATAIENKISNGLKGKLSLGNGALAVKNRAMSMARSAGRKARTLGKRNGFAKRVAKYPYKAGKFGAKGVKSVADTRTAKALAGKIASGSENMLRSSHVGNVVANKLFKTSEKTLSKEALLLSKENSGLKKTVSQYNVMRNNIKRNKLVKAKSGLASKSIGDILETTAGVANLGTTMTAISNLPQQFLINSGTEIVSMLAEKGIKSAITTKIDADGNSSKVLNIDSTNLDLNDEMDRYQLVGELQTFALEEISNNQRKFTKGYFSDIVGDRNDDKPLYTEMANGEVLVDSTLQNGIDNEIIKRVFTDETMDIPKYAKEIDEIKDTFRFEPVTWADENGVVRTNNSKFKLVPKNPENVTARSIAKAMTSLKAIDTEGRTRLNKPTYKLSEQDTLKVLALDFKPEELSEVQEFVSRTAGVSLVEGNKLVYDTKNINASNAVRDFKKSFNFRKKANISEMKNIHSNLGAFVSKGVDAGTAGFQVFDSKKSAGEINQAFGEGYASNYSYDVALPNTNEAVSNSIYETLVVGSASAKLAKDKDFIQAVHKKESARKTLRQNVTKEMVAEKETIGQALDYIKTFDNTLASSEIYQKITGDYQDVMNKYKSKNISEQKMKDILPHLANQTTDLLMKASLIEGFASETPLKHSNMDEEAKKGMLEEITKHKEKIAGDLMLKDVKDVDKYNIDEQYVSRMAQVFGDNGEVVYNKQLGKATVKTASKLSNVDNILNAFTSSDYSDLVYSDSKNVSKYMEEQKEALEKSRESNTDVYDSRPVGTDKLDESLQNALGISKGLKADKKVSRREQQISVATSNSEDVLREIERLIANIQNNYDSIYKALQQVRMNNPDKDLTDVLTEYQRVKTRGNKVFKTVQTMKSSGAFENKANQICAVKDLKKALKEAQEFQKKINI